MANSLKGLTANIPSQEEENQEYKDCGLHISQYKLTKLPMGNEHSHSEFVAVGFKGQKTKHGWGKPEKTDEEIKKEATEMMRKKEAKMLEESVASEPTDF